MRTLHVAVATIALITLVYGNEAIAQLTDESQTAPNVPGGAIAKSLDEQIGAGHGDEFTYGSAVFLIKRDPARSIRRGRQLFQRKFTSNQGVGPRVDFDSSGDIRENRALGAGLADNCAACHGRPRGAAGFGGDVVTRPDSRDAPHLFGLGLQEMLADEITADLRRIRDEALAAATSGGEVRERRSRRRRRQRGTNAGATTRRLVSKGISFGSITVFPDGRLDVSRVEGVDDDLRVRPFFHHGETASIREFSIGAFKAEMGLESPDEILCAVTDPVDPQVRVSPAGFVYDPAQDTFERPPVCDEAADAVNFVPHGFGWIAAENEITVHRMQHVLVSNGLSCRPQRLGDYETTKDATPGVVGALADPDVGSMRLEVKDIVHLGGDTAVGPTR